MSQTLDQGCWVILSTDKITQQLLTIEPYAIGWSMLPGQKYYVYLLEEPPHLPHIRSYAGGIQVFASRAVVYLDGTLLVNFANVDILSPHGE